MFFPVIDERDVCAKETDEINSVCEYLTETLLTYSDTIPGDEDDDTTDYFLNSVDQYQPNLIDPNILIPVLLAAEKEYAMQGSEGLFYQSYDITVPPPRLV